MEPPEILYIENVDSTNDFVKRAIRNGEIDKEIIVYAKNQTRGKGRMSNIWLSEDGKNLIISILCFPDLIDIEDHFYITKVVSLSLVDFLKNYINGVSIKWPNDIYVSDKKIAGILIENTIKEKTITTSIIGIGLNVNQTIFDESLPNPISLKLITNKEYDIEAFIKELFSSYHNRLQQLKHNNLNQLDTDYSSVLYKRDEWCTFKINSNSLHAKIIGVNPSGLLMVEQEEGGIIELDHSSVSWE